MLLCTVQALGELAVLFPINGAFYTYVVRFVDPSLYVTLLSPRELRCALANRYLGDLLLDGTTPLAG